MIIANRSLKENLPPKVLRGCVKLYVRHIYVDLCVWYKCDKHEFELACLAIFSLIGQNGFHQFKYGQVCSYLKVVAHKFANHMTITTSRVTVQ
jgi:hypothetical protein